MKKYIIFSGIVIILILLAVFCTTVINHGEAGIFMQFGKPISIKDKPGLYLKLPYPVHVVKKIDVRLQILEPSPAEFLTADKKNLIVESAICYRIADPVLFMKTVRNKKGLDVRLTDLLTSHTGLLLGVNELSNIVNTNVEKVKFQELNDELSNLINNDGKGFGIEVEQVLIKRIMLPQQNMVAVYNRMRAERNRIAKKYIAEGQEQATQIRAEADKASRTLIAEAQSQATIIKGKADADAMKIYGEAYQKDSNFYKFIRSLEAYEKMFNGKTVIVLDDDSPIVKTLFSGGY